MQAPRFILSFRPTYRKGKLGVKVNKYIGFRLFRRFFGFFKI